MSVAGKVGGMFGVWCISQEILMMGVVWLEIRCIAGIVVYDALCSPVSSVELSAESIASPIFAQGNGSLVIDSRHKLMHTTSAAAFYPPHHSNPQHTKINKGWLHPVRSRPRINALYSQVP